MKISIDHIISHRLPAPHFPFSFQRPRCRRGGREQSRVIKFIAEINVCEMKHLIFKSRRNAFPQSQQVTDRPQSALPPFSTGKSIPKRRSRAEFGVGVAVAAGVGVCADAAADGGVLREIPIRASGIQLASSADLPASPKYLRPYAYGTIYFLRGNKLEALAYPRTHHKKIYCWKKMNFPTLLPKADPQVKYLVASSFRSGRLHAEEGPMFRMHVVVPVKFESDYMLCHIRRVGGDGEGSEGEGGLRRQLRECFEQKGPDFYSLFMLLHNNYHIQ